MSTLSCTQEGNQKPQEWRAELLQLMCEGWLSLHTGIYRHCSELIEGKNSSFNGHIRAARFVIVSLFSLLCLRIMWAHCRSRVFCTYMWRVCILCFIHEALTHVSKRKEQRCVRVCECREMSMQPPPPQAAPGEGQGVNYSSRTGTADFRLWRGAGPAASGCE